MADTAIAHQPSKTMAQVDRASDTEINNFNAARERIAAALAFAFGANSRVAIAASQILDSLSVMVAVYSYGNGDIHCFVNLNEAEISLLNVLLLSHLDIEIREIGQKRYWFERRSLVSP